MLISELKPNPKNPRQISDRRLEMLQASLQKFGDLSGFVDNVRSGTVISGHQKQKVVPPDAEIVIERRFETPTQARTVAEGYVLINGERFKYRQVDADEVWETEAMLAANKQGGEWDNSALIKLIVETPMINIEHAGFQVSELSEINISPPKISSGHNEEQDAAYVRDTVESTEQIDTEHITSAHDHWSGMPEFEDPGRAIRIMISFENEETKSQFLELTNLKKAHSKHGSLETFWWPFKEREDVSSLEFRDSK